MSARLATTEIAVVGMACEYPDASSPAELWENVLARRRAFRRLPAERLSLEDYWSADRSAEDAIYSTEAALIEGYEFDRVRFRVPGPAFRAADLSHWLALDVACRALDDAGFSAADGLPRETTGVVVGNTLTGELSRAGLMRLRWPYVRRVVDAALCDEEMPPRARAELLARIEAAYKEPFEPVGDESLAGALSNTIAGRICNHLDLGGGGYTVDGACAASLLAITTSCDRLASGELDVALAGGVDISIDPFELVGFAKAGALATDEMRVYDARGQGFWPGEGSGFLALMRLDDARAEGAQVHGVVRGWGVSSDGAGGITRPEQSGQLLALRRAYRRAGVDPGEVGYFEGHGTGTVVGDATELRALSALREGGDGGGAAAAVGSVKANIGHTKAAAGVAGAIKALMAVREGVIPPNTACEEPHPELEAGGALRVLDRAEPWGAGVPVAGVSGMGFGGINTHVVIAGVERQPRSVLGERERLAVAGAQDAELFLFAAASREELAAEVERVRARAAGLSRAELADVAAELARRAGSATPPFRAAAVASRPAELAERLGVLADALARGSELPLDPAAGVFLAAPERPPRIGLLMTGQGSPVPRDGGALQRRFPHVGDLFEGLEPFDPAQRPVDTRIAQPSIVAASLATLRVLESLGLHGELAVGHSLGELTALAWAGAFDEEAARRIATARGRAMSELGASDGAMATVGCDGDRATRLSAGLPLSIAGLNGPAQTALSGRASAIEELVARARIDGVTATRLPVSHAFHSPLVEPAADALAACLGEEAVGSPLRRVFSTVTGRELGADEEVAELLVSQVTAPVRFTEAVGAAAAEVDLFVEVGPGDVLAGLARGIAEAPAFAVKVGGRSLAGLMNALGAAWAIGAQLDVEALFVGRLARPIDLDAPPRLFANPCEQAPRLNGGTPGGPRAAEPGPRAELRGGPEAASGAPGPPTGPDGEPDRMAVVRALVAERAELPAEAVTATSRMLDDLHLNSIVVSEIAAEAARRLSLPPPLAPTEFANATVEGLAEALADAVAHGALPEADADPAGAGPWTRAFEVVLEERPLREGAREAAPAAASPEAAPRGAASLAARWRVLAPPGHPGPALLEAAPGGGVAVCLPPCPDERVAPLLLDAARAVLAADEPPRLLVWQHGGGGGGFARTLHLESGCHTALVDAPFDAAGAQLAAAEAAAADGFAEAHIGADGVRRVPLVRHLPVAPAEGTRLTAEDVLVVTGGGKGIAAECALDIARGTGAAVGLIGRSAPDDAALAANLDRFAAAGVRAHYARADVTDPAAVRDAVAAIEAALGAPTAVIHAAGANQPALLADLDEGLLHATIAPKVAGLRNVVDAAGPERLRLLVTFGSIIARTGLRGDAHYAIANEWQTLLTERFARDHPRCACLAFESSVWSSVGMGQRLGSVDAFAREGVDAIPPEHGARLLRCLIDAEARPVAVVAAGRLGRSPTLEREGGEPPLRRFLERPRVDYPGIELVVDAEVSPDLDPYLEDHVLDGERLFPAVMGLEAMAQAVGALTGDPAPPAFEDVRLERPIVIPPGETTALRVAVLADGPTGGRVVLRSERTRFQVDHFSARWTAAPAGREPPPAGREAPPTRHVDLTSDDLYGTLLFQSGRLRRVRGYSLLTATECVAELAPAEPRTTWFGAFLPQDRALGDPGIRDAALHAIQACVPHARVVPVGVERVEPAAAFPPDTPCRVHARERAREEGGFVYDMTITGPGGIVLERWTGLRLRVLGPLPSERDWPAPLLATYLERRLGELGGGVRVALDANGDGAGRRERSDRAIATALGGDKADIARRPDGRPELNGEANGHRLAVSTSHAGGLTLAVAAPGAAACDVEPVQARAWSDLLAPDRRALAELIGTADQDAAATRVWAATECLLKSGAPPTAPLTLRTEARDGWVLLDSGAGAVATYVARVRGAGEPLALAILLDGAADARV